MDEIVKAYVEKLLEVRETRDDLSEAELKEIAIDLGLSERDLEEVEERTRQCAERGRGSMKHLLWDDAIAAWQEAVALAPTRHEYRAKLARCLVARGNPADLNQAKRETQYVLERDPSHDDAYEVLREIEDGHKPLSCSSVMVLLGALAAIVLLIAVVMVAVGIFVVSARDAPVESGVETGHAPSVKNAVGRSGTDEIAVAYKLPKGIAIEVHSAAYDVYEDKSFYKFVANVVNGTDRELQEVKGTFTFQLDDGSRRTKNFDMLATHDTGMRPGDRHAFDDIEQFSDAKVTSVELEVVIAKETAAGVYPEAKPVDLKWDASIDPNRWKLEVKERSESLGSKSVVGRFHKVNWEFWNHGGPAIKILKVQIDYLATSGESIEKKTFLVAFSGTPPIGPDEMRADGTIQNLKENAFDRYELTIVEIN